MLVAGIGNVTQVTNNYVFTREGDKQDRIRVSIDTLKDIHNIASANENFYERMWDELYSRYEKFKEEVERKYHFISDDDVKDAYEMGRKEGFMISLIQPSNNDEYLRQNSYVHGLFMGVQYAHDNREEAYKIRVQTEYALKGL